MGTDLTLAERAPHMITGTIIGIGTVFAILILFWGLLVLMKFIFARQPKPKKTQTSMATQAPEKVQNSLAATVADDTQLIAVLTAAVACMMEAQGVPATSFKIKSFRRTN